MTKAEDRVKRTAGEIGLIMENSEQMCHPDLQSKQLASGKLKWFLLSGGPVSGTDLEKGSYILLNPQKTLGVGDMTVLFKGGGRH
ncbi:hypothetical protein CEXT_20681 [Caerostris extrusa]|uniref:Uncharacterized protein n=1 Tax=Caerostris extrusa TaxID=172846 RepID=A0AAV4WQ01_CAEEX|nr:hypothetical protein CEXT_20681 [Caerostris extrusa]